MGKKLYKSSSPVDPGICIVGAHKFQNELLANFIERNLSLKCSWHVDTNYDPHSLELVGNRVIIWDCLSLAHSEIWVKLIHLNSENILKYSIVFINITSDSEFEIEALSKGIKGVFYVNDTLATFEKGLQAILNGELWFSRQILSKSLQLAQIYSGRMYNSPSSILTKREQEILTKIAAGATNTDISDKLCISPHTVKTHINNIYGKINAPNRVQAVLWAAKNL